MKVDYVNYKDTPIETNTSNSFTLFPTNDMPPASLSFPPFTPYYKTNDKSGDDIPIALFSVNQSSLYINGYFFGNTLSYNYEGEGHTQFDSNKIVNELTPWPGSEYLCAGGSGTITKITLTWSPD